MSLRLPLIILFVLAILKNAAAQDSFQISGVVKDEEGLALPGASVLLSGYQKGAAADGDGRFRISGLAPGSYDVMVQMVGYFALSKSVTITNQSVTLELVLQENKQTLGEIVIRPDPNRKKYLSVFREYFIGTSSNSKSCVILNPQVIDFDYDGAKRVLTATSREFLIIENRKLGYRIKYLLKHFQINDERSRVSYYGLPYFEELNKSKASKFTSVREKAYKGSAQHFFKSLLHNRVKEEGFLLNKLLLSIENPDKAPEHIIQQKLRFFDQSDNENIVAHGADSLEYWQEMNRKPFIIDFLVKEPILTDTLLHVNRKGDKFLDFDNGLYVVYKGGSDSFDYRMKPAYKVIKPYEYRNYRVSVIKPLRRPIRFYKNGNLEDPQALLYEGYWSYEKVGEALPLDYIPLKKKAP